MYYLFNNNESDRCFNFIAPNALNDIKTIVKHVIPGISCIICFGSAITPAYTPYSDLDIVVICTDPSVIREYNLKLSSVLNKDVDIISIKDTELHNFKESNLYFYNNNIENGVLIR